MATDDRTGSARLALRLGKSGSLDDVAVEDVRMFRAEMLDEDRLWLCCYLAGTGVEGDRVTFEVVARGDRIEFEIGERPAGAVSVEATG